MTCYTDDETAHLICWNDYCIVQKIPPMEFISRQFETKFNRVVSWSGISDKIHRVLLAGSSHREPRRHVLSQGTRILRWGSLSEGLRARIEEVRNELDIPILQGDALSSRDDSHEANSRAQLQVSQDVEGANPCLNGSHYAQSHRQKKVEVRVPSQSNKRNLQDTGRLERRKEARISVGNNDGPNSSAMGVIVRDRMPTTSKNVVDKSLKMISPKAAKDTHPFRNSLANLPDSGAMIGSESPEVITIPKSTYEREQRRLKGLGVITSYVTKRLLSFEGTNEEYQRLSMIQKEVEDSVDGSLIRLIGDLVGTSKELVQLQNIMRSLVGTRNYDLDTTFPQNPPHKMVDQEWKSIREDMRRVVGRWPPTQLPAPECLQRFALNIDGLLTSGSSEGLRAFVIDIHFTDEGELKWATHTLLGALFFRHVFGNPSQVLQNQHSGKVDHLYRFLKRNDGIPLVQQLDMIATKLLVEDPEFRRNSVNAAIRTLSNAVVSEIKEILPLGDNMKSLDDVSQWFERGIQLMIMLLFSCLQYRIFYYTPGVQFDGDCMQAEDMEGRPVHPAECFGKRVRLCLFPAIVEYHSPLPRDADIISALAVNRKFFPHPNTMIGVPTTLVSKAVVLVE